MAKKAARQRKQAPTAIPAATPAISSWYVGGCVDITCPILLVFSRPFLRIRADFGDPPELGDAQDGEGDDEGGGEAELERRHALHIGRRPGQGRVSECRFI